MSNEKDNTTNKCACESTNPNARHLALQCHCGFVYGLHASNNNIRYCQGGCTDKSECCKVALTPPKTPASSGADDKWLVTAPIEKGGVMFEAKLCKLCGAVRIPPAPNDSAFEAWKNAEKRSPTVKKTKSLTAESPTKLPPSSSSATATTTSTTPTVTKKSSSTTTPAAPAPSNDTSNSQKRHDTPRSDNYEAFLAAMAALEKTYELHAGSLRRRQSWVKICIHHRRLRNEAIGRLEQQR